MEVLPDGKLAVGTRRGDIYFVEGAYDDPPTDVKFTRWATGLHEFLGLAYNKKDGYLYAIQRGEVTRLKDTDNRGHANVYETFCDDWGISGDYHEYAFMSNSTRTAISGSCSPSPAHSPATPSSAAGASASRPTEKPSPPLAACARPAASDSTRRAKCFYSENQGPWNGADALRHLVAGNFQGHPIGNKWYDLAPNMGERGRPTPSPAAGSTSKPQKIPQLLPPAIIQPYVKLGQSQSGIVCDMSDGKFGPFERQMFCGDQHHSNIGRFVLQTR